MHLENICSLVFFCELVFLQTASTLAHPNITYANVVQILPKYWYIKQKKLGCIFNPI